MMRTKEEKEIQEPKLQCLARGRHVDDSAFAVPSLSPPCRVVGMGGHVFGDDADVSLQSRGSKPSQPIRKGGETETERRGSGKESQAACAGRTGRRGEEGRCQAASPAGVKQLANCHLLTHGCVEPADRQEPPQMPYPVGNVHEASTRHGSVFFPSSMKTSHAQKSFKKRTVNIHLAIT